MQENIRDYTDILHLIVLSNLEVLNASMIENNISQSERLENLNITARKGDQVKLIKADLATATHLGTTEVVESVMLYYWSGSSENASMYGQVAH